MSLWQKAKSEKHHDIDQFESQKGYAIDEQWFHNLALQTQVVIKNSRINYQHGRLLYSLLSSYVANHRLMDLNILETGTARGFASLWKVFLLTQLIDISDPYHFVSYKN